MLGAAVHCAISSTLVASDTNQPLFDTSTPNSCESASNPHTCSDTFTPRSFADAGRSVGPKKRMRLIKRTSVDVLPPDTHAQFKHDVTALSRSLFLADDVIGGVVEGGLRSVFHDGAGAPPLHRRASLMDSHILKAGDPMISQSDRDLNSPVMFLHHGGGGGEGGSGSGGAGSRRSFDSAASIGDRSVCLEDLTSAMDTGMSLATRTRWNYLSLADIGEC